METQIGQRALTLSKTISMMPEVITLVEQKDPDHKLQRIISRIEENLDVEFIVIGDTDSIRLTHPKEERIGEKMVGEDNDLALLRGQYYVSKSIGTLGPSIRGKSPIFSQEGKIVGIVSVGYLETKVKKIIRQYRTQFFTYFYLALTVTLILAFLLYRKIKHSLLGYEPRELSRLFLEKQAILNAVKEAIVATNSQGEITLFNKVANRYFHLEKALFAPQPLHKHLVARQAVQDLSIEIDGIEYVCNLSPMMQNDQLVGMVSSCRKKEEIDALVWELTRVKQYSERLREKKHEFSNLLHLISGYIQIGEYEKAIELISQQHLPDEKAIEHFQRFISDPVVASIFIGKYYYAFDKGVNLTLDENSSITHVIDPSISKHLLTILGNIINNAIDASQESEEKHVSLYASDEGNNLIFEVEDSGGGIDGALLEKIFERGFTTKGELHSGYGLFFVKSTLERLGGFMALDKGKYGTIITIHIPKGKGS
jgi:sensor histidine kinase regulating citrate/malate metabolism